MRYDQGYYLRIFRARYDLSQAEAAQMFKMSASHWSLIEDGKRTCTAKRAEQFAEVTNAPIELFLGLVPFWKPER